MEVDNNFDEQLTTFRRRKVELCEAPEFTQRLTSFLEVEVGKSAAFIGQFKSVLDTNVRWFKDEEQILEDSKHVFECVKNTGLVKLTILHLNRKDEGAYKCRVENQEGVATTTGYLSVIASKNRNNRKSSKRKCGTERVSSPPLLNPIVEQKSVEESEEKEYRSMPPSPLHDFLSRIRHSAKSMNAPIVYGALENFNDILDMNSLADDEEVFEVNKKVQRSSDEEDFSTEESSSSEAEAARTPITDQNLPQMLGLGKNCERQISIFTPVRVYTAAKRRHQKSQKENSDPNCFDLNIASQTSAANRPNSLNGQLKLAMPNPTINPRSGDYPEIRVVSNDLFIHIPDPSSFVQSSLSSQSRPLMLSSKSPQTQHNGHVTHLDEKPRPLEWTDEVTAKCCLVTCFATLVAFLSIMFSLSQVDVLLFVCLVSVLYFLKLSAQDQ